MKNPLQQEIGLEAFCIQEQAYLWHPQNGFMAVFSKLNYGSHSLCSGICSPGDNLQGQSSNFQWYECIHVVRNDVGKMMKAFKE